MTPPPRDNSRDRATGALWEREFCKLAAGHGFIFTPHQLAGGQQAAAAFGRDDQGQWARWLLPDVTIWSAPGQHHEIKHKNKTNRGAYGLELYRLRPLIQFANRSGQDVYYTIHDWEQAGASSSREPVANRLEDWVFASVADLSRTHTSQGYGPSYVSGEMQRVEIRYWEAARYFRPLADLWVPADARH